MKRRSFLGGLSTLTFGLFQQRCMVEAGVKSPIDIQGQGQVFGLTMISKYREDDEGEPLPDALVAISTKKELLEEARYLWTLSYLIDMESGSLLQINDKITPKQLLSAFRRHNMINEEAFGSGRGQSTNFLWCVKNPRYLTSDKPTLKEIAALIDELQLNVFTIAPLENTKHGADDIVFLTESPTIDSIDILRAAGADCA